MSSLMFNHSTWYFVQCDVQSLDDRHTRSLFSMLSHVPSPEISWILIKIVVFSGSWPFQGGTPEIGQIWAKLTKKTCFLRNFTKLTVFSMGTRLFVDFVKIEQNHPNFTKFRVPGGGPLSPLTGLGRYTPQPPPGLTDMTPVSEWSIGVATPPRRHPPPPLRTPISALPALQK